MGLFLRGEQDVMMRLEREQRAENCDLAEGTLVICSVLLSVSVTTDTYELLRRCRSSYLSDSCMYNVWVKDTHLLLRRD